MMLPASKNEFFCYLGLLIAAVFLYCLGLDNLPLRDWDEGIVAQVAREISNSSTPFEQVLHPTIFGEPYFNKPPLVHLLIASAYAIGGVSEWTTRLPPALLAALSVPLLYALGREIFSQQVAALFAACVYLTWLPVVRHARLAMLDGAILCFEILLFFWIARAKQDSKASWGIGISLMLIALTKGVMLAMLFGLIGLMFLLWDCPQLLRSKILWISIIVSLIPAYLWYGAQAVYYGTQFLSHNLIEESFSRIWNRVGNHEGTPWFYFIELAKYAWPWLIFIPNGISLAWRKRSQSWAKLLLIWSGIYFFSISWMETQLPWYILPLYPALALIVGRLLAEVWQDSSSQRCWRRWTALMTLLAGCTGAGFLYFGFFGQSPNPDLRRIFIVLALTIAATATLIKRKHRYFIPILILGLYASLGLFFVSEHWIWEIAETYPVQPVAKMIKTEVLVHEKVYTSYPFHRPSLDFYSERQVIPIQPEQIQSYLNQNSSLYLLISLQDLSNLKLESTEILGTTGEWVLIRTGTMAEGISRKRAERHERLKRPHK